MTGRWQATGAVVVLLAVLLPGSGTAGAAPTPPPTPTAPAPTSTAASPAAPDPAPPSGGRGPGGVVPGGAALAGRALVTPPGAPPLPAGVTAGAWVLADLGRGTVLAARDAHGRYQPASILKTLTALVLLPRLPAGQKVAISQAAADTEGSAVGLVPGGDYTADTLFQAMLLASGNDATEALTGAAGGDADVVAAMNDTVRGLGGWDTVAATPTGLDTWTQLTSAYDMALVLRAAAADPRLLGYDAVRRTVLPAQTVPKNGRPVGTIEVDNQSTDFLDGYPGALFAKTGFTDAARHTFLAAARRGDTTLGLVFLRAERAPTDQWQQAATLFDWGFARPTTSSAGVGTLDDAAALTTRSDATTAASGRAASASPTTTRPTTSLAAAGDGRPAAWPGRLGPEAYGVVALVFAALLLRVERRRRRR